MWELHFDGTQSLRKGEKKKEVLCVPFSEVETW